MDDALMPHLRVVHQYPAAFPRIRIDRGAVRFVLAGATLMAPGLTSPGGRLPSGTTSTPTAEPDTVEGEQQEREGGGVGAGEEGDQRYSGRELDEGDVVVVEAEGKEEACLVGQLRMSTAKVKALKKGVVVDQGHFLGDGLWRIVLE
ncbi:MAG: hypothetical protein LQ352_008197 [Teloschistes flavicans]|nr:MAG: hypothetical protein LQ352_008197 [Teloschistes flavicans]